MKQEKNYKIPSPDYVAYKQNPKMYVLIYHCEREEISKK